MIDLLFACTFSILDFTPFLLHNAMLESFKSIDGKDQYFGRQRGAAAAAAGWKFVCSSVRPLYS